MYHYDVLGEEMNRLMSRIALFAISGLGAVAFAVIALQQNESIGAIWIVTAAVCVYTIAYRFYSRFIAERVDRKSVV